MNKNGGAHVFPPRSRPDRANDRRDCGNSSARSARWRRHGCRSAPRATQLAHTTPQFARRHFWILQRDGSQPGETRGVRPDDLGDVIVESARKIESIGRLRPITEHHRHGREHLHGNAGPIALLDPARRVPCVVADLAKKLVADHHPRATGPMMLHPNESGIAIPRVEVGPFARENVGMKIDFHRSSDGHANRNRTGAAASCRLYTEVSIIHQNGLTGSGFATLVPHFLQVRRASSFQKSSIARLKCSTMSPQSKSISSTSAPQFSQ